MRRFSFALVTFLVASAAQAETIRVQVWFPANSDSASSVRSIQVEPFGGDAGEDLTIQVEDALRGVNLDGRPYFQVIPSATGSGGESLLRGTAETEQRFSDFTEERERCVKDASGKCTSAREKYTVGCRRRTLELVVALRLIGRDGTLLWADNRTESFQDSHCADAESSPRARSSIARELNGKVASRVRMDFAPRRAEEDVRVDENRKGLNKPDSEAFKAAIKATKTDAQVACQAWEGIGQRNPSHAPTQYNLGLCAESGAGTADHLAQPQYSRALDLDPKHKMARRGLDRLAAAERALRQIQSHQRD
jgi:hypothetical protein